MRVQAASCCLTQLHWDNLELQPCQLASLPLLTPLLDLVQLQELAPLAQARQQVGALHLKIPRLRLELLQAVEVVSQRLPRLRITRFALAPLANELGAQPDPISMPAKLLCMG